MKITVTKTIHTAENAEEANELLGKFGVSFADAQSREADRAHSCGGKVRYGRHSTALMAVAKMLEKGIELEPYYCPTCDGFHLGHKVGWFVGWLLRMTRKASQK